MKRKGENNFEDLGCLFLCESFHDALDRELSRVGLEVVDDGSGGEIWNESDERLHKMRVMIMYRRGRDRASRVLLLAQVPLLVC